MSTMALDIGGANIKAAHIVGAGTAMRTWSHPFALWRSPGDLVRELAVVCGHAGAFDQMLVTMTAELCDCFATKREGVEHVLGAVDTVAAGRQVQVWSTNAGFMTPAQARTHPWACAAGNWHALATLIARVFNDETVVLVDTGSTTTDIITLDHGDVRAVGLTDARRLASGELVYIGAARTPLCALGPSVQLIGTTYGVMAEHFATSADVFVLTGDCEEQPNCNDTADGRPLSRRCAAARVLRMIGADLELMAMNEAQALAHVFAISMRDRLAGAITRVIDVRMIDRIILSGSGAFLAQRAADGALPSVTQTHFADLFGKSASHAACAVALLALADHDAACRFMARRERHSFCDVTSGDHTANTER